MKVHPRALLALILLSIFSIPSSHKILSETLPPYLNVTADLGLPVRVIIPSIGLNSPILEMGLNKKGELDVPNGRTENVGWYKNGAAPGAEGSAVFDAHVFAAFKNLKYLTPGAGIYVVTTTGEMLHFITATTSTYKLRDLAPETLFGTNGNKNLNLITCAGNLTPDHSTYDHRLVVFAQLVDKTTNLE